jgi:hypothetical protein
VVCSYNVFIDGMAAPTVAETAFVAFEACVLRRGLLSKTHNPRRGLCARFLTPGIETHGRSTRVGPPLPLTPARACAA